MAGIEAAQDELACASGDDPVRQEFVLDPGDEKDAKRASDDGE
jgi:hypothetical protein